MRGTRQLAALLLGTAGCAVDPPPAVEGGFPATAKELEHARRTIVFEEVISPPLENFNRHWSLGSRSAWFDAASGQALVLEETSSEALRVSGFPRQYGTIVATGWEGGKNFFAHLSRGADFGTMFYLDLDARRVQAIYHWAAW